ncbi:MAG: ABC transporter substrate-binding protein [Lachnospiraceae bacterium]|nr:ABC transporter substrate-binding protein [Lachnospiraceae bacterium]
MKKIVAFVLAMVMCMTCLAGCGGAGTGSSGKNTAIKIGGTAPLTGDAAIYGNAAKRGAEIAVEEINALGGLQFELKYEDDEHNPEKAVNAYNAVKDWGMQISLGSVTSGPGQVTAVKNFEDKIFALTPSASVDGYPEGKDNVYQMCFADTNQGTASAQYIYEQKLGTKVAVIYQNDSDYSTGIYNTFKSKADELGLEIVSTTTFISKAQDFSVQIAEAKSSGADLVFLPIYYSEASLILAQCANADFAPKFFGVDGMDGILTLDGFDTKLAEGVMLLTPFSADAADQKTQNFVATYQQKYGEIPNQFAADAYDCIYAIYQACVAAGVTADMKAEEINEKMIEQFSTMTFSGLTGDNMTWTNGYVSKSPKGMVIENGVYVGLD